ncbi:D-alanine--D-alanine ligase family protein [Peptoniphilus catoniae]|uniref:D-alanine--D-alanine ligase family protein n=1 Tax=Peptoniphilus catoniae TaxID=1660341 RepID=UPI0010FE7692|nr:D-alanine--D-alanine ligase family protein [Peptoniphilus catoniae]
MKNIAVIFGGRSVEHEVSIITGMQIIENMDKTKYNPIPVYITKDGRFLSGESIKTIVAFKNSDFSQAEEVFFKPYAGDHNLYTIRSKKASILSKESDQVEIFAKIDAVFPAVHGTNGEDGTLQGLLEMVGIPYVGCGVMSAAVGMDKVTMKDVYKSHGIPMTQYTYFYRSDWQNNREEILKEAEKIGYNLFVKPANLGSSIGISKACNREELISAIDIAVSYDSKVVIEKAVENPREINISVLGYEDNLSVSACEEPVSIEKLLTYDEKYISGSKGGSKGMKGQKRKLPADLKEEVEEEIERLAKEGFKSIGASGVARIDFLLDKDKVYLNEINTLPGSISFYLWEPTGLKFSDLITRLIEIAEKKYEARKKNITSYDSQLLNKTSYGAKLQ